MRYVTLFAMAIVFAGGCQNTHIAEKPKLSDAESREVFKAERLGEELYLQDVVAAKASLMLLQKVGPIEHGVLSGWIVVKDGVKTLTRFIKQTGEDINVIYDVQIDVKGDGTVTKDDLRPLSKTEIAMFRARQNALRAAPKDCARGYNTARRRRSAFRRPAGWCRTYRRHRHPACRATAGASSRFAPGSTPASDAGESGHPPIHGRQDGHEPSGRAGGVGICRQPAGYEGGDQHRRPDRQGTARPV